MVTESFTVDEFSKVLEDAGYQYDKLGYIQGEYCFAVDLGKQVSIRIRSSIRNNGHVADSGSDSIRLWLCYRGQSLSAKDVPTGINERYLQRVAGWQERLVTQIEKLRFFRTVLGDCQCGYPRMALISHTAKNPGRVFTKCVKCEKWGAWLDTDMILKQAVLPMLGANVTSPSKTNEQTGEQGMFVPSIGKRDDYTEARYRKEKETGRCSYCGRLVLECVCDDVPSVGSSLDKQEREWRVANLNIAEPGVGRSTEVCECGNVKRNGSIMCAECIQEKKEDLASMGRKDGNGHTVNSDSMDAHDNSTQPVEPVSTVSVGSDDSLKTGLSFLDTPLTDTERETVNRTYDEHKRDMIAGLSFLSDVSALTVEPNEPKPAKVFTPSKYQSAIFDFVKSESSNAVVEAVAGSGKTTTLVKALEYTSTNLKVGFVAFNKHIAVELEKKAPEHVHVSTLHSLGYANIRKMLGNQVKLDDRKLWHIFDEMTDGLPDMVKRDIQQDASIMIRLVNLCKGTLREPNQENIDYLCDRYGIEVNGHKDSIYDFVGKMWHRSFSNLTTIDYEDMIFASAYGICPCEKFDVLFIDEGQDLNKAQIEMSLKSGSRIVVVADRRQSIYGFRGADTEAVPNMIHAIDAKLLPLSISYRCPKSVVELAKTIVPQIEYREDAPDGKIDEITEYQFNHQVQNGDLVLCRTNAPLIKPCFDLIRRGVKATIRGRDIGSGLIQLLEKHAKRERTANLKMLLYSLDEYVQNESSKLIAANKGTRAQSLQDQFETLLALSDGCYQVSEVKSKVARIFSDGQAAVTFSSVHRSKGDESNRVFILHPELLPHPLAKQSWEQMQESNLKYVAITRSKSELYWVTK